MKKMQSDLNGGMRAILLDWLADVGLKVLVVLFVFGCCF
jgi:hypothetical protein